MEGKRPHGEKHIFFYVIGVALFLLLLFLLRPYVVSIVNLAVPRCVVIVPEQDSELVSMLRGLSFKEGWLYLFTYSNSNGIVHVVNRIYSTMDPYCVVIGIFEDSYYEPRSTEKIFVLPREKDALIKYIIREVKNF